MISIIEREIVDRHHWIRRDDFLDLLAIAQSLPGILAVNISTAVGDKLKGTSGSIVAALGTMLPSFLIILAIAIFLTPDIIKNNHVISSVNRYTIWIPLAVAAMISLDLGFVSNPILYIILGAAGGFASWWIPTHRRPKHNPDNDKP